jgi:hypothetical protein
VLCAHPCKELIVAVVGSFDTLGQLQVGLVNSDGSDLLMWIKPGLEAEFGRRWKGFGLWRLRGREYGSF